MAAFVKREVEKRAAASAWSLHHRHGVICCIVASPCMIAVGALQILTGPSPVCTRHPVDHRRGRGCQPVKAVKKRQAGSLCSLLCEFARKKENPPVKWYLKPLLGTVSYVLIPTSDALPTIGSCSAELPVLRGRGHSHASRCLCVRDQETSLRFRLLPVLAGCRHQESNEVAVATLCMPARVGPDPWHVPLPSFLSLD